MIAVAGQVDASVINVRVGCFVPSSVFASSEGMENFSGNPDLAALRKKVVGSRL